MNRLHNWWIRFSSKYLGYTYYVDMSNLPPSPAYFTTGHCWSAPLEFNEAQRYSITGCECGAKLRSTYPKKGCVTMPETESAMLPCPFAEKHAQEKQERGW
jgi:hypothetical protein